MKLVKEVTHWALGIRFYIAVAILLFTLESIWWAETSYGGSLLFATRLEELYAWLALGLLGSAVTIGPLCSTWPKLPGKQLLYDARRLLGIGAFWFSSLHVAIAYDSLFKFANPFSLPGTYQRSFAAGAVALLILLAMAFTSFDKAFNAMGRWWFRLHRLVYVVVILSLFHAFLIGAQATNVAELLIISVVVLFTLGLHTYLAFFRRRPATIWQMVTLPVTATLLVITLMFGYNQHFTSQTSTAQTDSSSASMPAMPSMEHQQ